MIFPSDFLDFLYLLNDNCLPENCPKHLETCCSLQPLLSQLHGHRLFPDDDDLEQLNPDGPQLLSFSECIVVDNLTQYRAGDKIKKNEMGWACGAYG